MLQPDAQVPERKVLASLSAWTLPPQVLASSLLLFSQLAF